MRAYTASALAILALFSSGPTQARTDELVEKMRAVFRAVNDYTCELRLNARIPDMSVSGMRMTLYYKSPDKVKVEAKEGFAMLPQEGLYLGNPIEELLRNFTLRRLGNAQFDGVRCVKYEVRPKGTSEARLANVRLYVDTLRALPVAFTGESSTMGSVSTTITYSKVQGKWWLPATTTLKMKGFPRQGGRLSEKNKPAEGSAQVSYSGYKVNSGLPDSLFRKAAPTSPKTRKTQ